METQTSALVSGEFLALTSQTWLYVGAVALFLFCIANFAYGGNRTRDERTHTMLHGVICAIAGTAYFAMASGVADTEVAGRNYDYGRYIDWSVTTPLLLLGLSLTAYQRQAPAGILIGLLVFDQLMIITGFLSGFLSNEALGIKILWFVLGDAFFLAVLYLIWTSLASAAKENGPVVQRAFTRNAALLSVLWLIYPVVFILGHNQLGLLSQAATAGLIVFLDVSAKGVYGLVSAYGTKKITDAQLSGAGIAQPGRAGAEVRPAPA